MSYIGNKPANKAVVASDLDPAVITGQTALAVAPADTDEFLISDAGVLKRLDASLVGGGGKINQVIYGSTTTAFNTSSTSYVDTGLTATITPTATSSKVIVLFTQAGDFIHPFNNGINSINYLATFRGSTEIAGQKQECKYGFGGYEVPISFSGSILDSPNTTNATAYKTMAKTQFNDGESLSFQIGSSRSQMILMEVLA